LDRLSQSPNLKVGVITFTSSEYKFAQ